MMRGFDRHRLATFLAVLALLVQQGLIPVLHFALGAELADRLPVAFAAHQAHQQGNGNGDAPGHADQGPCHFCRILAAALPPPPVAELHQLEPTRIVFAPSPAEARTGPWFSRAHPVRGPPAPPILI